MYTLNGVPIGVPHGYVLFHAWSDTECLFFFFFSVECHPSNGLNAKEKHLQLHLVLKQTAPGTVHERPAKHQQGSTFHYTPHPACEKIPLFQVSRKPGCRLYREPEGPEPLPGGQKVSLGRLLAY